MLYFVVWHCGGISGTKMWYYMYHKKIISFHNLKNAPIHRLILYNSWFQILNENIEW